MAVSSQPLAPFPWLVPRPHIGGHHLLTHRQSSRELDILLALCKTAPRISTEQSALLLLKQLQPYVGESCYQAFTPSPLSHSTVSCPWEVLTFSLTRAILQLASRHQATRPRVLDIISNYLSQCRHIATELPQVALGAPAKDHTGSDLLPAVTLGTSMVGFLDAAAEHAHFWSAAEQRQVLDSIQAVLQDRYLVVMEHAAASIRNSRAVDPAARVWRHHLKYYAANGRPLTAMLLKYSFMGFAQSCASSSLLTPAPLDQADLFKKLTSIEKGRSLADPILTEKLVTITTAELSLIEEGSEFLQMSAPIQHRLAASVKSRCFTTFLCCALASESLADPETLLIWLDWSLSDPAQLANSELASAALGCQAVLATRSPAIASNLSRSLPQFLTGKSIPSTVAQAAAESLLAVLRVLPQDTVITTLYGLGNSLSTGHATETPAGAALFGSDSRVSRAESKPQVNGNVAAIAHNFSSVPNSVITVIVTVARGLGDEKIIALALSMLVQKVGKVSAQVDLKIISEVAPLAADGAIADFKSVLRLYDRLTHEGVATNNDSLLAAVEDARLQLGHTIQGKNALYEAYLQHLLEQVVSQGESRPRQDPNEAVTVTAIREMAASMRPLAELIAASVTTPGIENADSFPLLQRDAWYNIVVHGFGRGSLLADRHFKELKTLARYTHPLIDEQRAETLESDIDLNIVLRRAKSGQNEDDHKKRLKALLPGSEGDLRPLDYPELIFLEAMHLVETLRAEGGDCTQVLHYFVDPFLEDRGLPIGKGHALARCMEAVAMAVIDTFLGRTTHGREQEFSAPYLADQLSYILKMCCHPIKRVQTVAFRCASKIVNAMPSVLCQRSSLFALLDLLTLMWTACLESETNEYDWRDTLRMPPGDTTVHLSDDYDVRNSTLSSLYTHSRSWILTAIETAPLDVKGLLQTYLSEHSDDEAVGHLSLGRSVALEMGSITPEHDQRLLAVATQENLVVNTASDFMAQYTTRQEYRFADPFRYDREGTQRQILSLDSVVPFHSASETKIAAITERLAYIEDKFLKHDSVPLGELREALRKAASLLCRVSTDESTVIRLFVGIPFYNFTKQSIKLGLSMWMGVIKENPRMESRIVVEIIENWIGSVHRKLGLFSKAARHIDPFYEKEEFAPSDLEGITKKQHRSHDLIAPHFRLLQFLSSHYNAARLSNQLVEKAYLRLLITTLEGLQKTPGHPLAREIHFHILLLAERVLDTSTVLEEAAQWRLKDAIIVAGLSWFRHPPRWTFGVNRLQVKAETKVLSDVANAIEASPVGKGQSLAAWKSLESKQRLLLALIENEIFRLSVWLSPLEQTFLQKLGIGSRAKAQSEASMASLVSVAWQEDPAVAIHLTSRFKQGLVAHEVRQLLLRQPEKALDEPDALSILIGNHLPNDVVSQLKYLLYWAPVNPVTAVTYFLPAYKFHPSVIQYAVRALESHSIDITFFYVPQIVQSLRYDELGYVARYIVETGKFSQLFAHQIIWNMKANAYKDEEATNPDPVKPTLDKVMDRLIGSFSGEDKSFYEREFAFFNEVTSISGKLKPFIKKSKMEKKQKIEEELRQIQIDVGVYLPSNPDGSVIGIDRKSGKPLQSHAKAPYMATFRVRRDYKPDDFDEENGDSAAPVEEQSVAVNGTSPNVSAQAETKSNSKNYEVWQSAIFKVGDDCRQDVLALQMIAAFRGIFHSVGLPVFVFPYRVTATAPGCGVIDVLPNSVSRDMLGREAVNGLKEWFESRFGNRDAPAFQKARANFVKSLAAYSIISYLLQFKDRHNGNIMFDDSGHILHIDFGFCFDICPGGVKFERAPFKLTKEMVAVMGGTDSQSFRWFEELCVKAFLASRQHAEVLQHIVVCMLDSGLPCFKPETLQHFRERFVLEKTEREAAGFVRKLVQASFAHWSTKVYDQYQLATNGIPY